MIIHVYFLLLFISMYCHMLPQIPILHIIFNLWKLSSLWSSTYLFSSKHVKVHSSTFLTNAFFYFRMTKPFKTVLSHFVINIYDCITLRSKTLYFVFISDFIIYVISTFPSWLARFNYSRISAMISFESSTYWPIL